MKKVIIALFLFSLCGLFFRSYLLATPEQEIWEKISVPADDLEINAIAIDPLDPHTFYIGSTKNILKTRDSGKSWRNVLKTKGSSSPVNSIVIDDVNPISVYAATKKGLYKSDNWGKKWRRLFKGMGQSQNDVQCILLNPYDNDIIYIGTKSGLFISKDAGRSWKSSDGEIAKASISYIVSNGDSIFIATNDGIFESRINTQNWDKILTSIGENSIEDSDDSSEDEALPSSGNIPNCLVASPEGLYAGTNAGAYFRDSNKEGWSKLPASGLSSDRISHLLTLKDGTLYAATNQGIFKLPKSSQTWVESYKGLLSKNVNFLAYSPETNMLLAATNEGLFRTYAAEAPASTKNDPDHDTELRKILANFKHEPTVNELLEIAIKYAEVNPEKIQDWRKSAQRKALLPILKVGIDHGVKDTYEIYTSASRSYWTSGPTSQDTNWDVSLSWDLGDLVWNESQTSIDVRSKLMVQLRDDILDEVRSLYFERRRLQISLITDPPITLEDKLENQLRLEELTAGIDALTGGWFSKHIRS